MMFKFAVFLVCLSVIEGRNIQRLIRDADVNATALDLNNATANKTNEPPELTEMQSDLVAPASGPKPLQAKYTIRVKPRLKDGVPQIQEIRIMPPKGNSTIDFVKPLMVLKQNVTKPMIENIEIDVPEKGRKYSAKPSVEVVEGDHREMLQVSKGQAEIAENAAQKSDTKSQDQEDKPTEGTTSQDSKEPLNSQNSAESSASQNATAPSNPQNATEPSTAQDATKQLASQNTTKPSTSQDAPDKNSTTSAQTSAVSQSAVSANQPASQPQASAQTNQPVSQPQASAPAASTASVYAQPAAAVAAYNSVPETCTDDGRCQIYPEDRCREQWLMTNCRLKCKLCSN